MFCPVKESSINQLDYVFTYCNNNVIGLISRDLTGKIKKEWKNNALAYKHIIFYIDDIMKIIIFL